MNTYFFQNRNNGEVKSIIAAEFKTALTKCHFRKGWDHIWTQWA